MFPPHVYLTTMCTLGGCGPEEKIKFHGIGVTYHCKSLYEFWEFNLGTMEDEAVLLNAKPSLYHQKSLMYICMYVYVCMFVCVYCLQRPQESLKFGGTGVRVS